MASGFGPAWAAHARRPGLRGCPHRARRPVARRPPGRMHEPSAATPVPPRQRRRAAARLSVSRRRGRTTLPDPAVRRFGPDHARSAGPKPSEGGGLRDAQPGGISKIGERPWPNMPQSRTIGSGLDLGTQPDNPRAESTLRLERGHHRRRGRLSAFRGRALEPVEPIQLRAGQHHRGSGRDLGFESGATERCHEGCRGSPRAPPRVAADTALLVLRADPSRAGWRPGPPEITSRQPSGECALGDLLVVMEMVENRGRHRVGIARAEDLEQLAVGVPAT